MRVLVVDQDSASNEAIVRSLREHYVVDAVTNKGDCLDLLRSNTFEVVVAGERLEDGSGLDLLGTVSKKYPSILRIFAADRHRLQLLKGRLGPFELFQTLTYPIDLERLLSTLTLADAAQDADADTSNIQHVVLSGSLESEQAEGSEEAENSEEAAQVEEPDESREPEPFPPARPESRATSQMPGSGTLRPRAGPQSSGGSRGAGNPAAQTRSAADRGAPAASRPRPRRAGAPGGAPTGRSASAASTPRPVSPSTPRSPSTTPSPRHGRSRSGAGGRLPPVRFPPLEAQQEAPPPLPDAFAEAAALARAARDSRAVTEEPDYKRIGAIVGAGAVIVLGVAILGFKLFGSKSDSPKQAAAPPVQAPQYPPAVTDLIAQTEAALSADDYKSARTDVDKLRELAPAHPRLQFFDGLLAQKSAAAAAKTADAGRAGNGRAAGKHRTSDRASNEGSNAIASVSGSTPSGPSAAGATAITGTPAGSGVATVTNSPAAGAASSGSSSADVPPGFAPETPPGVSRAVSAANAPSPSPGADSTSGTASRATAPAADNAASPPGSSTVSTYVASASTSAAPPSDPTPEHAPSLPPVKHVSSGEPPPVVREAKLIRRVNPDYPSAAKKEGVQGFVDLQVTVSPQGAVTDARVVNSTPPDVFDKAALTAVRKWKYDPRFVDGLPSQADLAVHLDFNPAQ
jgi:periplasmic protein TonB